MLSPKTQTRKKNRSRYNGMNAVFDIKFRAHIKRSNGWTDGLYILVKTEKRYGTTHYQLKRTIGYKIGWVRMDDMLNISAVQY